MKVSLGSAILCVFASVFSNYATRNSSWHPSQPWRPPRVIEENRGRRLQYRTPRNYIQIWAREAVKNSNGHQLKQYYEEQIKLCKERKRLHARIKGNPRLAEKVGQLWTVQEEE